MLAVERPTDWHAACFVTHMGIIPETWFSYSASDWIAIARIGQMIEDVLKEEGAHVDVEAPTQIRETFRDTIIDV